MKHNTIATLLLFALIFTIAAASAMDKTNSAEPTITANNSTAESFSLKTVQLNNSHYDINVRVSDSSGNTVSPPTSSFYSFAFFPLNSLENMIHTLVINVSDSYGNTIKYTYPFNVASDQQKLTLISPASGGTKNQVIDVVIGSQFNSNCRWKPKDTTVPDANGYTAGKVNAFGVTQFLAMTPIATLDGRTHTIGNFFTAAGVSLQEGTVANISVTCNISTGGSVTNLTPKVFKITYVTLPPTINIVPKPGALVDLNDPSSLVTITTNQESWCIRDPQTTPVLIDGDDQYNAYTLQRQTKIEDNEVHSSVINWDHTVVCKNRAGLSASGAFTLIRDYDTGLKIDVTSPLLVNYTNNYYLYFSTNKASACSVAREGLTYNINDTKLGTLFKSTTGTAGLNPSNPANNQLARGENNFTINCTYPYYDSNVDQNYETQTLPVIVFYDGDNPQIDELARPVFTCNPNKDTIGFTIYASDDKGPSKGIVLYEYNITERWNQSSVAVYTKDSPDFIIAETGLSLKNNTNYLIKARVEDASGRWSSPWNSTNTTISDGTDSHCDVIKPTATLEPAPEQTFNGTNVYVSCQDDLTGTGCNGVYINRVPYDPNIQFQSCTVDCKFPQYNLTFNATSGTSVSPYVIDEKSVVCWTASDVARNCADPQTTIVDILQDPTPVIIYPGPLYAKRSNYAFTFTTDKKAYCSATRDDDTTVPVNLWPLNDNKSVSWKAVQTGPQTIPPNKPEPGAIPGDGQYLYHVTCTNRQQPTPSTQDITVNIDSKEPILRGISTASTSCGLSQVGFTYDADDQVQNGFETGIQYYNYTIIEKTSGKVVLPWSASTTPDVTLDLTTPLTEGTIYTIKGMVTDYAGNMAPSSVTLAKTIDFTGSGQASNLCDKDAPDTSIDYWDVPGKKQFRINCADNLGPIQSGCNQTYWLNTAAPNSICTASKIAAQQFTIGTTHNITSQKNVCWIVRDNNNIETRSNALVDGPAPQNITLVSPPNGGATNPITTVTIGTYYPAVCKWALGNRIATPTEFNTAGLLKNFDITTNNPNLQTINDFFAAAGIAAQPAVPVNFSATCFDGVNYAGKTFTIEYLTTGPSFTTITVNPQTIADPYSPNSTITLGTDQDTLCTSPTPNIVQLGSQYSYTQNLIYSAPLNQPAGDIPITIICANRAAMTATTTQTITVDYTQPLSIRLTALPYSRSSSYNLVFTSNKLATCTVTRDGSQVMPGTTGTSFSRTDNGLVAGINNYTVSCDTGYSTATEKFAVIMDNRAPTFTSILGQSSSCGLASLSFTFNANDQAPSSGLFVNYNITNSSGTIFHDTTSNMDVTAPINLIAGQQYTITAKAFDAAGNQGPIQTKTITATTANDQSCDHTPPQTTLNTIDQTPAGTTVMPTCTDSQSGCKTTYYFTAVDPSQSCTVSRAASYTLDKDSQSMEEQSKVCWTVSDIAGNENTSSIIVDVPPDTVPLVITLVSSITTNNRTYPLQFTTNKASYCSEEKNGRTIIATPNILPKGTVFSSTQVLNEGDNTFTVTCRARQSDSPVQQDFIVTADSIAPRLNTVSTPGSTCSINSISFTAGATDAAPSSGLNYNYIILDASRAPVAQGTSTDPDMTAAASFIDGVSYTINVTAVDGMGNPSNSKTATTITRAAASVSCDNTPPTSSLSTRQTVNGTYLKVQCTDASGCREGYYLRAVSDSSNQPCTVTKTNQYKNNLSTDFIVYENSTVCWIVTDTAGNDAAQQNASVDILNDAVPVKIYAPESGSTATTKYRLEFTTDKAALCAAAIDTNNIPLLQPNQRSTSWKSNNISVSEGQHTISINCTNGQQAQPTQTQFPLIADSKAPVISSISTQNPSCGLNTLTFTINAADSQPSSGMSAYYYTLVDKATKTAIIPWTSQKTAEGIITDLSLAPNSVYTLTAVATDNAGNPSRNSSVDVTATETVDFSCDNIAPLSWLNEHQTPAATLANVSCSDPWSGCNSTYWYNALLSTSSQACIINTASNTQKHNLSDQYSYNQDQKACWVVRDNKGNQALQQNATIEAPLAQTITLVLPVNGGTNDSATDFVVATQYPSSCSWLQSSTATNNSGQFNLMKPITERSTDNTLHIVRNIYSALNTVPQDGTTTSIAVTCNDGYRLVGTVFRIIYTTKSANITITANPNPIVDPTNPLVNITVSSNQDVVCTLEGNDFGGDFSLVQQTIYTNTPGAASQVNLSIACTNRVGMTTVKMLTINTNYLSDITITQTSPTTWKTGAYELNFKTNKQAYCQASRSNNDLPLTPIKTVAGNSFRIATPEQLTEGNTIYRVDCWTALNSIVRSANMSVLVDSVPPTIHNISTATNTCDLSSIKFSIEASDTGGISSYSYSIKEKSASNYTIGWKNVTNPDVQQPIVLKNNTKYTISATATDYAGNTNQPVSVDVTASDPDAMSCDTTPPGIIAIQNMSKSSTSVYVRCTDADSGCKQTYWYTDSPMNTTCAVNKTGTSQELFGTQHAYTAQTRICWIGSDNAGNEARGSDIVSMYSETGGGSNGVTLNNVIIANATVNGTNITLLQEAVVTNAFVQGNRITSGNLVRARSGSNVISGLGITDGIILQNLPNGSMLPNGTDTCSDGVKQPSESDIDCGGHQCADLNNKLCANNQSCQSDKDCQSNYCLFNVCAAPSCTDGVQNGQELGVDCGGPCSLCTQTYNGCRKNSDCKGNFTCQRGTCAEPPQPEQPGQTTGGLGTFNLILVILGALMSLGGAAYMILYQQPKTTSVATQEQIQEEIETEEPLATFEHQEPAVEQKKKVERVSKLKQKKRSRVFTMFQTPQELSNMDNVSHKEIEHAFNTFDKDTFTDTTKQLIKDNKVDKKDVSIALTDLATHGKVDDDAIEDLKKEFELERKEEKEGKQ